MIILGIDPGTAITGYGVIEKKEKGILSCIAYNCIYTSKEDSAPERLRVLENELISVIRLHNPDIMAVEKLFFTKNIKTALPVSEARGVILLTAAKHKIPIHEFTPPQVKMAVTGYGRAEKKQVQAMVAKILSLPEIPKPDDAADALGVALSYIYALKKG